MKDALRIGNRLIMLHNGNIILDLSKEEKQNMEVSDLLKMFERASGEEMDNDRMLLG
jgi:putative ABC transport system ATP-binding protein